MKSLFHSVTFWSIVFLSAQAITPTIEKAVEDGIQSKDIFPIVNIVAATGLGIMGRMNAKDGVYTPGFLPGPNKVDPVKEEEKKEN